MTEETKVQDLTTADLVHEHKRILRDLRKKRDAYIKLKVEVRILESRQAQLQDEMDRRGR